MPDNPYQPPESDPQAPARGVCPCCGSEDLCAGTAGRASFGQPGTIFIPHDWPTFRLRSGLDVEATACRRCGYVSLFIAEKDMGSLQSE